MSFTTRPQRVTGLTVLMDPAALNPSHALRIRSLIQVKGQGIVRLCAFTVTYSAAPACPRAQCRRGLLYRPGTNSLPSPHVSVRSPPPRTKTRRVAAPAAAGSPGCPKNGSARLSKSVNEVKDWIAPACPQKLTFLDASRLKRCIGWWVIFRAALRACQGATPEDRHAWRDGIYAVIHATMQQQGPAEIERRCGLAGAHEPGRLLPALASVGAAPGGDGAAR
jgi:hypothetical protein